MVFIGSGGPIVAHLFAKRFRWVGPPWITNTLSSAKTSNRLAMVESVAKMLMKIATIIITNRISSRSIGWAPADVSTAPAGEGTMLRRQSSRLTSMGKSSVVVVAAYVEKVTDTSTRSSAQNLHSSVVMPMGWGSTGAGQKMEGLYCFVKGQAATNAFWSAKTIYEQIECIETPQLLTINICWKALSEFYWWLLQIPPTRSTIVTLGELLANHQPHEHECWNNFESNQQSLHILISNFWRMQHQFWESHTF